jgi:hypothetical protein
MGTSKNPSFVAMLRYSQKITSYYISIYAAAQFFVRALPSLET